MSRNNDFRSTLKSFTENLSSGNKSVTEVAGSINEWLKEGGEALRLKIEDEVERSVSKMGFIKRGEFEALRQQVAELASSEHVRREPKLEKSSVKSATSSRRPSASNKKRATTKPNSGSSASTALKSSQAKKSDKNKKEK
jgi:hypothetical protein